MSIEFQPFPKLARLNRNITITEKLDGTNAAVVIVEMPLHGGEFPDYKRIAIIALDEENDGLPISEYHVYAQSRNKFITPGKSTDNYGFAGWVQRNAEALVAALGAGTHFGEWWGSGIQRGYGLPAGERRFSLFNTKRWDQEFEAIEKVSGLASVPVLYEGPFDEEGIHLTLEALAHNGSAAADFDRPEGIVIYHEAARQSFKITLENDAAPNKGIRNAHDLLPEPVAA